MICLSFAVLGPGAVPEEIGMPAVPGTAEPLPRPVQHGRIGFAMNVHAIQDIAPYFQAIDDIAAIGANSLLIVTPLIQENTFSTHIGRDPERVPTQTELQRLLLHARSRGLSTGLMPVILLSNPETNQWRGKIAPEDWFAWWSDYELNILQMADLAQRSDVNLFFVGSELNSTEEMTDRWVDLIDKVRRRFSREVSYSANWDRFARVRFWESLDLISVSAWFELSDEIEPTDEQLMTAWEEHFDAMLAVADRWDRPILLSEVGYPSVPWALAKPWNYIPRDDTLPDWTAQQRGYETFFSVLDAGLFTDPRVAGFFCYEWDPLRSGGREDFHYGVRGKPARQTVRTWFQTLNQRAAEIRIPSQEERPETESPEP